MAALAIVIRDETQGRVGYRSRSNREFHPRGSALHRIKDRTLTERFLQGGVKEARIISAIT